MDVVIHVGLPKTGSTFLQQKIFPHTYKYEFYTTNKQRWPSELNWIYGINHPSIVSKTINTNRLDKIKVEGMSVKKWVDLGRDYYESIKKPLLLSSEGLCGVSWNPLINSDVIMHMLKQIFENIKVILIIRRQDKFCESIYKQIIYKENRFRKYISIFDMYSDIKGKSLNDHNIRCSNKDLQQTFPKITDLNWHRLISNYQCKIGTDNVLSLPFEMLESEPKRFISRISDFIEEDIKPSDENWNNRVNASKETPYYSPISNKSLFWEIIKTSRSRKLPQLTDRLKVMMERLGKQNKKCAAHKYVSLSREEKALILENVKTSNEKLSKLLNTDLRKFGYH